MKSDRADALDKLGSGWDVPGFAAACSAVLLLVGAAPGGGTTSCPAPQTPGADGFCYPAIELRGDLRAIFTISECRWISGMTCRIAYKGPQPLPSEVFFTEFGAAGEQLGAHTRLIYPNLRLGEGGLATFRTRAGHPSRIVLEGVWSGPWKDPY